MSTFEAKVAAWLAKGNPDVILCIYDARITTLGDLPATVKRLCLHCPALTTLGRLPDTLTHLYCEDCTALVHLSPLPATFTYLFCANCPALTALPAGLTGLTWYFAGSVPPLPAGLLLLHIDEDDVSCCLPPLPATLRHLRCSCAVNLPDACPPALCLGSYTLEETRVVWRTRVRRQHTEARHRTVAHLPSAAALYV